MKLKALFLATVTFCISIAVTLILGEILLRVAGVKSTLVYLPNPFYGWGLTPNAEFEWETEGTSQLITVNSRGLRDREFPYTKPPNTTRIMILGDSFAEAKQIPLEQSFSKLVERRLELPDQQGLEVINTGASGYGTDNALLFYEHEGHKYQPDLVVLALYIGNDVRNNWYRLENIDAGGPRKPYFVLERNGLVIKAYPFTQHTSVKTRIRLFFNRYSVLYSFSRETLNRFRREEGTGDIGDQPPLDFGIYELEYSDDWQQAWRVTEALIDRLNSVVNERGGNLVVMLIPGRFQVHQESSSRPSVNRRQFDLEKPNRWLHEILQSSGIEYLDMLPILRSTLRKGEIDPYLESDGHWNTDGHRIAATHLAGFLQDYLVGQQATGTGIRAKPQPVEDD